MAYSDLKHLSAYFNYGDDSGTNVLLPDQAQYYDVGGGWANQTFGFFGATRKIGEYYDPVDGFVSHPGIAGYALYSAKIWDFDGNSDLKAVGVSGFVDRYQGPSMGSAQSDNQVLLDVLTKNALDLPGVQWFQLLALRRRLDADFAERRLFVHVRQRFADEQSRELSVPWDIVDADPNQL